MNDFQKNKKVFNNFLKTHVLSHKFDKQLDPLFHEIQAFEKGITSLFGNTSGGGGKGGKPTAVNRKLS